MNESIHSAGAELRVLTLESRWAVWWKQCSYSLFPEGKQIVGGTTFYGSFEFTVHCRNRCMTMIMQPLTTKWHSVDSPYSFNFCARKEAPCEAIFIFNNCMASPLACDFAILWTPLLCCRKTSDLPWTALMKIFDQKSVMDIWLYIYIIYDNV